MGYKRFLKLLIILLFIFIYTGSIFSAGKIYRYGIIVGSSKGMNENDLSGVDKLVKNMASFFKDYCLLDDNIVLIDPNKDELNDAFEKAKIIFKNQKNESQFFFYYYGHGVADGLLLNNEIYRKNNFKEKIESINADLKFVFLDACQSQVLSNDTKLDFNTNSKGTVFITSSTQFQKAYTDVFTPILKSGLMGDADGFIPNQIDAQFFFNEISTKLSKSEQKFIQSLYGLNEYYTLKKTSVTEKKKMEKLLISLGIDYIPKNIHINVLEDKILKRIKTVQDEEMILNGYNYNQNCFLKKQLSETERKQLVKSLEKVGFKKNNHVTLSELFSYIQSRIAEKNVNGQRPTITTDYLTLKDPIPLSYFENKIRLCLAYPGTIFIKKVRGDNNFEDILKIKTTLGNNKQVNVALSPGKYKIIIETEEAKYMVDIELKPGEEPVILEELNWDTLTAYKQGDEWRSKAVLDKKTKIYKKTAWIPPFFTFTSLTIPFSILFSEIGYSYYLLDKYNNGTDPDDIAATRTQIEEFQDIRNIFYITAGICFVIPIIPLVIWIVQSVQARKMKKKIENIKREIDFSFFPELIITDDSFTFAFNIKI